MRTQVTSSHRLRPVRCVIDAHHRNPAVAENARRGRFTHAGVTLDLGRRPDWISDGLPDDVEWRIEWVKLYEGLDLAHAAAVTGDHDHAEAWQDLVESFCDQVPVGHDTSDVSARRVQNWIYAWQRLADQPGFGGLREGLAETLIDRIGDDVAHLRANLTPDRNHRTMEVYTLLLAGLALDDRDGAVDALDLLADNAATDILDDGVQRERSSDYHMIVLRSLLGAIDNALAADLPVPPELRRRADLAATFGLHLQRPDGSTPALSDGDEGDFRDLLALGARVLDRGDLAWPSLAGRPGRTPTDRTGQRPTDRHVTFPVGGYAIQRSDWDASPIGSGPRWAVLDCGPLGDGGHGHYDHLSVELVADHHRLVVDPGRYTYAPDDETEGWRHWFKGTAAHNTVCIDGLDQQPYRHGKPKGPQSTARLLHRHTVDGLDVVVAEATSPRYDAVHTRALALVDDDYWIIVDRIDDPTGRDHEMAARWHLDPAAEGGVMTTTAGDLTVTRIPGAWFVVPQSCGHLTIEHGWVAPTYGHRRPAPVLALTAPTGPGATIVTVVAPGRHLPRSIGWTGRPSTDGTPVTIDVEWDDHQDRIHWQGDGAGWERRPW